MPQLEQLPTIFWSQLFWLAVVFGILFFVIGRGMLPKIEATVDDREAKVAGDLAAAERARREADVTEEEYRARIDAGRVEALKVTAAAKQDSARAVEARLKHVDEAIRAKTEAAEAALRVATRSALDNIEGVAAEAAQDIVARLAGLSVGKSEAARAVQVAIHG